MKRIVFGIVWLAVLVPLLLLSSCRFRGVQGSGNMITESRKVEKFNEVDISGSFEVTLKQDSSNLVTITADDNLMKLIRTDVHSGRLRIYNRKSIRSSGTLTVTLGVGNLREVNASGAIVIRTSGPINAQNLNLRLSGASKVNMDLIAGQVITTGNGATELTLTGRAGSHQLQLSGAADVHALDFAVNNYEIKTSGASKCQIAVLNKLELLTSGASNVVYRGNPSSINNHKSGASSIRKIN